MAKVVLTVGYLDILLPDEKGVAGVLSTLARGVAVHDRIFEGKLVVAERPLEVSMKMVPSAVRLVPERDADRPLTPEDMGYVKVKPKKLPPAQTVFLLGDSRPRRGH